ncbi:MULTISPECIES: helix-turn-helix domain-containing protein [Providencia]|uniref:helix-turn-helix domain-containing protein n=1 Tax=Providencia TaxID=586 RepID=UPI002AB4AC4B|nr:helix-turn-helix transcriptional regulator [Providencia stuartii]
MNKEIFKSYSVFDDRSVIKKLIAKNIGEKIKKIRSKYKISGLDLANVLGVSQQQLSKYEKGLVDIPTSKLMLISIYFNVDVNYFFTK